MDKRIVALVLVVIIAVSAIGIYVVYFSGYSTAFQFTRAIDGEPGEHNSITIETVSDCEVYVRFVDDASLFYSVTVELDSPGRVDTDPTTGTIGVVEDFLFYDRGFTYDSGSTNSCHVIIGNRYPSAKIRHVDVTLGNDVPFDIGIGGENVTSVVVYDNAALLDSVDVGFGGDGSVNLTITEDVVYSGDGMDLTILNLNTRFFSINLNVDLPDDISGSLTMNCPDYHVTTYGWYTTFVNDDTRHYVSDEDPETLIMLHGEINTDEITAVLRD